MIDTSARWQDELMVIGGNRSDVRIVAKGTQLSPGLWEEYT
jgi:hypothetical protein